MDRRQFLATAAAAVAAPAIARAADDDAGTLKDFVVTRVTGFRHVGRRPKFVGKNSHLGDHGQETRDACLRIATDQGIEGIGSGSATPEAARKLLGMSLADVWKPGVGMVSPLGRADHALFDLVGKALGRPAWKLLGGRGPEKFPVYDGSLYFADLLPEHASGAEGAARLVAEADASLAAGHRALKVKVGRGFKWMERDAGFRRDVEVIRAIRERVGRDVKLMVDANNGFDPDGAMRWLDAVDDDLFFVEEMFPEQVEADLTLKAYLARKGWKTLLADGESASEVDHFDPYIAAGAMDVLQADVRAFGLTKLWDLSRRAEKRPGVALAPHNWGSFLGIYMIAVLGRGLPNVLIGEEDRSTSDLFDASAFAIKDGLMTVPDTPGCGLRLNEDIFAAKYRQDAWVVERR